MKNEFDYPSIASDSSCSPTLAGGMLNRWRASGAVVRLWITDGPRLAKIRAYDRHSVLAELLPDMEGYEAHVGPALIARRNIARIDADPRGADLAFQRGESKLGVGEPEAHVN